MVKFSDIKDISQKKQICPGYYNFCDCRQPPRYRQEEKMEKSELRGPVKEAIFCKERLHGFFALLWMVDCALTSVLKFFTPHTSLLLPPAEHQFSSSG